MPRLLLQARRDVKSEVAAQSKMEAMRVSRAKLRNEVKAEVYAQARKDLLKELRPVALKNARKEIKSKKWKKRSVAKQIKNAAQKRSPSSLAATEYVIQVGVFSDKDNASTLFTTLKNNSLPITIIESQNRAGKKLYTVQSLPLKSEGEAHKLAKVIIEKTNIKPHIKTK